MKKMNWVKIILELLVVFIGVFSAFLFDNHRENRAEEKRKIIYYESFLLELENIKGKSQALKKRIDTLIIGLEAHLEKEIFYNRRFDFTNNIYIIQSAFTNDNFVHIDPNYLRNIESGSNLIKFIEKRFNILEEETRRYFLQKSKEDQVFRNWYIEELKFISDRINRLILAIEKGAVPETKDIIKVLQN